jgi:hypothetical protein
MKTNAEPAEKAADFQNVGECLYRHIPTGGYYALVKRAGKQIRFPCRVVFKTGMFWS